MPTPRARLVVDPVWRLIDEKNFETLFGQLVKDARHCGFLGLDLEWTTRVVPREDDSGATSALNEGRRVRTKRMMGPVATVQLSSHSTTVIVKYCDLVGLHQGSLTDPMLPDSRAWPDHRAGERENSARLIEHVLSEVSALLADSTVAKVGVGVLGDKAKIESDYPGLARVEACVDLVAVAEHYLDAEREVPLFGETDTLPVRSIRSLKTMCSAFASRVLDKDPLVVCSAWGSGLGALSPLQVQYAGADAEASFDACVGILSLAGLAPFDVGTSSGTAVPPCLKYLTPLIGQTAAPRQQPHQKTPTAAQGVSPLAVAAEAEDWCKGREKPYYDNINVFDPDMNLVFTVDKSKAEWYVYKKALATVIEWRCTGDEETEAEGAAHSVTASTREGGAVTGGDKEIAAIQLCFSPDFRKYNDAHIRRNMDYFRQPKENVCVICGSGGNLVRFAVVPLMYRKYFPSVYMSHNSYDLLLLCTRCFANSRTVYEAEKTAIAEDFGIPIGHLTTKTAPLYDVQIANKEASLEADIARFHTYPSDDTVAHHLHPLHVLSAMREYRELQQHREHINIIFKYAKALRQHYASDQPRATGDTPQTTPAAAPSSRRYCGRRSRKQAVRNGVVGDGTQLPESRFRELCDYVDTHAPRYPFYDSAVCNRAVQDALFTERAPSSREGVELIVTGRPYATVPCTETIAPAQKGEGTTPSGVESGGAVAAGATERSYHSVLTQYWVARHPDLVDILPTTTREEERKRDHATTTDDNEEGDLDKVPYVDNHGFLVVKMLLQKYKDSSTGKHGEHAVGQFIYRWRTAFLSRLQPQRLPAGWVAEDGILM